MAAAGAGAGSAISAFSASDLEAALRAWDAEALLEEVTAIEPFSHSAAAHFADNLGDATMDTGEDKERARDEWAQLLRAMGKKVPAEAQFELAKVLLESFCTYGAQRIAIDAKKGSHRTIQAAHISMHTNPAKPSSESNHAVVAVLISEYLVAGVPQPSSITLGIINTGAGIERFHKRDAERRYSVFSGAVATTKEAQERLRQIWYTLTRSTPTFAPAPFASGSAAKPASSRLNLTAVYPVLLSCPGTKPWNEDERPEFSALFSKPQRRGTCSFRSLIAFSRFVALWALRMPLPLYKVFRVQQLSAHLALTVSAVIGRRRDPTAAFARHEVAALDRMCCHLVRATEKLMPHAPLDLPPLRLAASVRARILEAASDAASPAAPLWIDDDPAKLEFMNMVTMGTALEDWVGRIEARRPTDPDPPVTAMEAIVAALKVRTEEGKGWCWWWSCSCIYAINRLIKHGF